MTQSEATEIQRVCNEVLADYVVESEFPGKLECYDVLVSALDPNAPPILRIERLSPTSWGFQLNIADSMFVRMGRSFIIETRW